MLIVIYNIQARNGCWINDSLKKTYLVDTNDYPKYECENANGDSIYGYDPLIRKLLNDRGYPLDSIFFEYREVEKTENGYVLKENPNQSITIDANIMPDNTWKWQLEQIHDVVEPVIGSMCKAYPTVSPVLELRFSKGPNNAIRIGFKELRFTVKE